MKLTTVMVSLALSVSISACMAQRNPADQKSRDAAPGSAIGIKTGTAPTIGTRPETGYDTGGRAMPGMNATGPGTTFTHIAPDSLASRRNAVPTNARPEQLSGTVNAGTSNLNQVLPHSDLPLSAPRQEPNNVGQGW